ncbi:hypothetical protein [Sedimentitalea sp.]|uniref:hypothetical protein n=1 Tax=Sedimentitalea sp. TaxID=2048915 RepID=UPI003296BBBF
MLALAPLTALLFTGLFWSNAAVFRASIKVAVKEGSPLAWLVTGRLRALLGAAAFTVVAVTLLAWHVISSTYPELLLLAVLCLSAALVFEFSEHKFLGHLTPPFARMTALSTGTLVTAGFFIPIVAWANWNFSAHTGEIRTVGLEQALELGLEQMPERGGWIAELMAPFYALEYGKLWFVVQTGAPKWFSFWYSIDAALISVVAARTSAVLMSFVSVEKGRIDDSNITS